jgi:CDGSH-type Zn-finger protein/uncharacterized Fe-S cluster protein YjdI
MEEEIHTYEGEAIDVTYDVKRCIHARECVKGLPAVFDPEKRPWIEPDAASVDDLADVVMTCPTGALHFDRTDGGGEEPTPDENVVTVVPDGPLYLRGDVEIVDEDDEVLLSDTRVALCRCGASANKPLCDNSHEEIGFEADAAVERESKSEDAPSGTLQVKPSANGPVSLRGEFRIESRDGGSSFRGSKASLCRCGASATKPFCDASHLGIDFSTEE